MLRYWVGGIVAALLLTIAIAIGLLVYPAPLVSRIAQFWLGPEFRLGELEYSIAWEQRKLVVHARDLAYRSGEADLRVEIDHIVLAVEVDWAGRVFTIDEVYLAGASADITQHGSEAWWRQLGGGKSPDGEEDAPARSGPRAQPAWALTLRAVHLIDLDVDIALPDANRNYALDVSQFSSDISSSGIRRTQLDGYINDLPLSAQGESPIVRNLLTRQAPVEVDFDVMLAGVNVWAGGFLDIRGSQDTRIELSANVAGLAEVLGAFGMALPDVEYANASALIRDSSEGFILDEIEVNVLGDNVRIDIDGAILHPLQQWQPLLDVDIRVDSLQLLLARLLAVNMAVDFSIDLQGRLERQAGFLALLDARGGITFSGIEVPDGQQFGFQNATVRLPKDEIRGWAGPFELPLDVLAADLRVALEIADEWLYYDLPARDVGMVIRSDGMDLVGTAEYKGELLSAGFSMDRQWQALSGEIRADETRLAVTSDLTQTYFPLNIEAQLPDATLLNHWLRLDLPEQMTVDVLGSVHLDSEQQVSLHGFDVVLAEAGSIAVSLDHLRLSEPDRLAGGLQIRLPSLTDSAPWIDSLLSYADRARWLHVMRDLSTRAADIEYPLTGQMPHRLGEVLAQHPGFDGRAELALSLALQGKDFQAEDLAARFSNDRISLYVGGDASRRGDTPVADLAVETLFKAHGAWFDWEAPLAVSGRVRSDRNSLVTENFRIGTGDAVAVLNMVVDQPFAERPQVRALLKSDHWPMAPFLSRKAAAGTAVDDADAPLPAGSEAGSELLFSAQPLPLHWLQRVDALLRIELGQLAFNTFDLRDVNAQLQLKDGALTLAPVKLNLLDGAVFGRAAVSTGDGPASWELELSAHDLDLSALRPAQGPGNAGMISARAELNSRGASPHELASQLSGRVTQSARGVVLHGVDIDRLAPRIVAELLQLLNPWRSREGQAARSDIECQVAHLAFGEGRMLANRSIQLRTRRSKFEVTWMLDLATEKHTIQFVPRVREGFELGTSDIARSVQVTGTLKNSRLEVNPAGLLMVGAGNAFLLASGGWLAYLAWRQIDNNMERPDACERTIDKYMAVPLEDLKLPRRNKKDRPADS